MKKRANRPPSSPFTLVEMMVVLLIIAISMAIAIPRIGKIPAKLKIEGAQNQLNRAFTSASIRARAAGKPVRLTIATDEQLIRLHDAKSAQGFYEAFPQPEIDPADQKRMKQQKEFFFGGDTFDLPAELSWALTQMDAITEEERSNEDGQVQFSFTFYPDGSASGLRQVPFTLLERKFLLSVDRLTSRMMVKEVEHF